MDYNRLSQEHPLTIWIVILQLKVDGGMRNEVAAEFDTPVVLRAHNVDGTLANNYVSAEKNRGNDVGKKYMIREKAIKAME